MNSPQDEFGAAAVLVVPNASKDDDVETANDQTSLLSIPPDELAKSLEKINNDSDSSKSTPLLQEHDKFNFPTNGQDGDGKYAFDGDGSLMEYRNNGKVYREVIFVTVAVFMGYASLVVVQKKLYNQFESNNGGSLTKLETEIFEHGTSLVYFGNLCFRLLHNVVFAKITPRSRVVLSLILISVSMSLLVFMYFIILSTWVGWTYIAYLCGGVAIGSFESNLLSTITPLGPDTKV